MSICMYLDCFFIDKLPAIFPFFKFYESIFVQVNPFEVDASKILNELHIKFKFVFKKVANSLYLHIMLTQVSL